MKYNLLWVAWMSRWGQPSPDHAYCAGIFSDIEEAKSEGQGESSYRGNKYAFQHCPYYVDNITPDYSKIDFPTNIHPRTGQKFYVASVVRILHGRTVVHFLGVFSKLKIGREFAKEYYPGWKFQAKKFVVNEKMKR